jgi:hypothetical protein
MLPLAVLPLLVVAVPLPLMPSNDSFIDYPWEERTVEEIRKSMENLSSYLDPMARLYRKV